MNPFDRRRFLHVAGLAGSASITGTGFAQTASENIRLQVLEADPKVPPPVQTIRFAVIGLDHAHIMSMTAAVLRGGGQLVSVPSTNQDGLKNKQLAEFRARFGDVPEAASEDAILQDRSIQLVVGAPVPDQRAPLGIRVMKAEKDFLSDKPALTSLAQLAAAGSTKATVLASQTANLAHPAYPNFEDFGDMLLTGNGGTGYVRVDWFTPDGLATWGDGRLFILGTEGYIELRKYIDPLGRQGTNHLLLVDRKEARYMDCSKIDLPFGRDFVADIVNRTETAQNQEQALLAAELVLKAQKNATRPSAA